MWQYKTLKRPLTILKIDLEDLLNDEGKRGFELITVFIQGTDYVFFFKRRISR